MGDRTSPEDAATLDGSEAAPACTVIVPVYNGADLITRCLDALADQTPAAGRYEIVVVDDGSTDETARQVAAWQRRHADIPSRLVRQPNAGPAAARNRGAQEARGRLLFFTDADCAPLSNWCEILLAAFQDPGVDGAKGAYLSDQQALVSRFVQAEYEDRYDRMAGLERIDFVDTYSAAYRRDLFLRYGGFDTSFPTASVEDQEFSFRLVRHDCRLIFVPAAKVRHLHDETVGEYARRKYLIGYWKALLTRRYPERIIQDSHTPQVLKVQILLLGGMFVTAALAMLGLFWPPLLAAWWLVLLEVLLFVLTTLPFLGKLARRSPGLAGVGLPLLLVRAAALGSGYLVGMVRFANRPVTVAPPEADPDHS